MTDKELKRVGELQNILSVIITDYIKRRDSGQEHYSQLPLIKALCSELGLDWQMLCNWNKNETPFTNVKTDETEKKRFNSVIINDLNKLSVSQVKQIKADETETVAKCKSCNKELKGKKTGSKYCDSVCKNKFNNSKR
jgi:hypothetical protein